MAGEGLNRVSRLGEYTIKSEGRYLHFLELRRNAFTSSSAGWLSRFEETDMAR